ncbi:branched-chain amino acid ABC transporter permease [Candidimonas nitroreducens]|uniref:Amino acid ABC transporter n=1 Tax=Candidimonas nitroreducens TaxID=683354 RepID=A0A225M0C0_9BURK|nr:branched-chain amino acid ABC transporter permease [Candidimonas nitroreducens]OWT54768.1 amino acid ABC transporter [Candidimonas nitroreducens]
MSAISPYFLHIGVMTGMYVLLAQSLNIMLGYSGLLSLATPAFFGMGAYASTLLTLRLGWDSSLTLACATAVGALSGVVLGVPSLRLSRHSFVIVTLSATLLLQIVASNWIGLTRGALGIADIPTARLFGMALEGKSAWLAFMAVLSALAVAATWLIVSSRLGRAMIAVRDNEPLAIAAGIDPLKIRLFAFACSGALAGLAGACYAHYLSFIDPGIFGFSISESLLVMVILGGAGTLWGPVAGAVIFTVLPEALSMAPEVKSLIYGMLLLLIVLFMPQGMARWFGRPLAAGAGTGK